MHDVCAQNGGCPILCLLLAKGGIENLWLAATQLYPQLLDFLVVVLAVQDVPFLRAFQDGPALAFDLLPGGSVDLGFFGHQPFEDASGFEANSVAVFDEIHALHLGQRVGHGMRQLIDLLAADSHSTALYLRTSSFLIFLNIS